MKRNVLSILMVSLLGQPIFADILKDFDSLGGNKVLLNQAKELKPEKDIQVVQDRLVNRRRRVELYPEFSKIVGGNSYLETNSFGLSSQFHFNSRWSLGAKFDYFGNGLTEEGKDMVEREKNALVPDIDAPQYQYIGFLNWYPIYGKMNLYDLGIVHFDVYLTAGYGQVALDSGTTGTWQAGGGLGFWWSQHLTTRLEVKYQNYSAKSNAGEKSMDLTVLSLGAGFLL